MDEMQTLALYLEQLRSRLQQALLANPTGMVIVAERFLSALKQNTDLSELVNSKSSKDQAVQDNTSVQPNLKQFEQQLTTLLTQAIDKPACVAPAVLHAHFLPAFLLQVSAAVIEIDQEDTSYRLKLARLRDELQSTRQQMVLKNRKLVAFIVRKYKSGNISFHDLSQEGMVGLLKAVDRFDYRREIRFSTYASYWIRQTVSRLVVRQEKIVRLPFGLAEKAPTIFEIMRNSYIEENRWPTIIELKAKCDLSEEEIKTIISFYQASLTVSSVQNDEEDSQDVINSLQQHQFPEPLDKLEGQSLNQYLSLAIDSLPKREADILRLRFGLKNHHEMTLQAVAEQMQLTRERIRQIQNNALETLKQNFGFELKMYLTTHEGH
ncbi:sigma-70 family RNA polymerase sigma factor [Methylomarinum sp. Ch1-1]|uniref:Sigma-70 family RNA polymerase sigma factor n=1 Tax=Methylomarinum roseum TaxID=3067653 RepID=A0AAU7NTR1_9GAMM|nr:sigma-70 family RNA polymerase sigma factor [Methylomarinum sp. Ch1-1]MDP4519593.1 sigma-70 family RNA polymerase sigma factor [Methylomarinum sp. Ch1-1]